MLTVWGRRSSFNLQKVMWLVGELGIEHRHIELGGRFGGLDALEVLAMNPHGRVPVIDDDGTIVWESHTILRYLAARYGRGRRGTAACASSMPRVKNGSGVPLTARQKSPRPSTSAMV